MAKRKTLFTVMHVMDKYKYVEEKLNELDLAVQALSKAASEATGTELHADVCSGDEIEFRLTDKSGLGDPETCIRIEDIMEMIDKRNSTTI